MSGNIGQFDLLRIFKDNLVKFLDALVTQLPTETDLVIIRIMLGETLPIEQVMEIFSTRILPYTDYIARKDAKFFLECTDLFEGLKADKVTYFKTLWLSNSFNNDDREQLWKWFALFSKLAVMYQPYL
jgi:hypothetical protein